MTLDDTYFAPKLPLIIGAATTLFPFMGWLSTESGTVILVGSFPYKRKIYMRTINPQ